MFVLTTMNRYQAFGWHLLVSACVALMSGALVFLLLYPGLYAFASGVGSVVLLLLFVDMTLEPIITLIIFNPKKKKLKQDLVFVMLVQILALLYGLHTVFIARPVYVAFNSGRFDLVYANDISADNLAKATRPEFQSLPFFGPRLIASPLPEDPKTRGDIVQSAIFGGDDVQDMPQYYRPYAEQKEAVLKRIKPLSDLRLFNKNRLQELDDLAGKYVSKHEDVGYLPLRGKAHDLVVIVSLASGDVREISDLKPW